ncbi:sensor histidine kinase [Sphingobacterium hungaricum]|uniref:Histidine kinase n=1 Tax=Sphingobacterium hungaricum TaxID=2082723 RepID=A0A928YQE4_9SPHI|nr:histidine kinase [Sphingobacterium hungaricum]MBE8712303.1 histidine kinase [Sphingobacterium hungaricum]
MLNLQYIIVILLSLLVVGLVALCVLLYRKNKHLKKAKEDADKMHKNFALQFKDMHLDKVHAQLNPHLLKNVFNSILSHAYQTYYTMDKLANVLDYVLYESPNKLVSPKEEIEFALNLIEINKIKVSPLFDMKVKVKVDPLTESLYEQKVIAPLLTIDLIENAFKHADIQNPDAFISVLITFVEGVLSVKVSNKISNKTALKKTNSGIGTRTLQERLEVLYKNRYSLNRFVENDVYIAHLTLDLNAENDTLHTS